MTECRVENLTLPGVRLGAENPLPFFRALQANPVVQVHPSLPDDKRHLLGWQTGMRVLPYRMQDDYTRQREPLTFRAVVLENEILQATFLPELGGRLISLIHKPAQRELLARNPVFQPANLAIRNAWFSGGIEWNIGQYGHTFTTCSPVLAAAIQGAQGEPGLRLYEFERCKGLFWQMDFTLPPGSPYLIAHTRVVNPNEAATSMYWWTNIAVPEASDVRVLAPARQAIYIDFTLPGSGFGYTDLPALPSLQGADGTYAVNSPFANEFFFQCDQTDMPWQAALDAQGSGLVEASTARLKYRKLFCWGTHPGGRHWQAFLAPGGRPYIEIQAGLAPTQRHGLVMPARADWHWTEAFGYLEADAAQVHSRDWETAWQAVDRALQARMSRAQLYQLNQACQERANLAPDAILHAGSGWGAVELIRRARASGAPAVPPSFVFPRSACGHEQAKWINLLEQGYLPEQAPAEIPGEWMVQPDWRAILARSLEAEPHRHWYALLHYGVMLAEAFDYQGARAAWEESIRKRPSAWAYRNLGALALRADQADDALRYYAQAWDLATASQPPNTALAQEYMHVLCSLRHYEQAQAIYAALPPQTQQADRTQILRAKIALETGDWNAVDAALSREFAVVREGETQLTDLWFELCARRAAVETGRPLDETLRQEIQQTCAPPASIDFRSRNT